MTAIQATLWAPTVGEKEQDWDEAYASRWPESSRVLVRAERSRTKRRVRNSPRYTAILAETASADSSQSGAEQHVADTGEITTAARFWWNSVLKGLRTKMKLRSRAVTTQHPRAPQGSSSNHHDF